MIGAELPPEMRWADMNKKQLEKLAMQLTSAVFKVTGKSIFKEEFVTAGGVELKEINFKTFESKLYKNLFFAGEVLNIDAVTGALIFKMRGQVRLLLHNKLVRVKVRDNEASFSKNKTYNQLKCSVIFRSILLSFNYICPCLYGWVWDINLVQMHLTFFRDVAQPGSAHAWGAWGRRFKSCHPDK